MNYVINNYVMNHVKCYSIDSYLLDDPAVLGPEGLGAHRPGYRSKCIFLHCIVGSEEVVTQPERMVVLKFLIQKPAKKLPKSNGSQDV